MFRAAAALASHVPSDSLASGLPRIDPDSLAAMFVPISNAVVAGRYALIDEIGRGGMGVVWRARQTNLGVECAVKFIHQGHASDPDVRARFVREARVAASLKSPNSVNILDVDEWQGTLFIAMELLSGESLEARLGRDRWLSPQLTLEVLEQVARGLNKAHAARLVHRDLKPENIFIVDDEPLLVKILDFGIAKRVGAASGLQTTAGVLIGTPSYMSPEQAHGGKEIDFRSDLWSLAVVAFRCLTGVVLFEGDGVGQVLLKVMAAPIPAPRSIRPELPAAVDEWWFKIIRRDPLQRPPSATAVISGLRTALADAADGTSGAIDVERGFPAETPQPQSLQPTLQPVSSRPGRRSRPLKRYFLFGGALLTVSVWVLSIQWAPSTSSAGAEVSAAMQQGLRDESILALPATAGSRDLAASRAAHEPIGVESAVAGSSALATAAAALEPAAPTLAPVAEGADAAAEAAATLTPGQSSVAALRRAAAAPMRTPRATPSIAKVSSLAPRGASRAARVKPKPSPRAHPASVAREPSVAESSRPASPPASRADDPRLGF